MHHWLGAFVNACSWGAIVGGILGICFAAASGLEKILLSTGLLWGTVTGILVGGVLGILLKSRPDK